MTVTALITVHFGEINHTTCVLYFFLIQHRDKNLYCTDSFITRCQCGNYRQSMQREESQEIVAVKNKSLKSVTEEQLQAEILVFSVHTVNVNAAKAGKVLDKLSVNRCVYIFLFFFLKFRS